MTKVEKVKHGESPGVDELAETKVDMTAPDYAQKILRQREINRIKASVRNKIARKFPIDLVAALMVGGISAANFLNTANKIGTHFPADLGQETDAPTRSSMSSNLIESSQLKNWDTATVPEVNTPQDLLSAIKKAGLEKLNEDPKFQTIRGMAGNIATRPLKLNVTHLKNETIYKWVYPNENQGDGKQPLVAVWFQKPEYRNENNILFTNSAGTTLSGTELSELKKNIVIAFPEGENVDKIAYVFFKGCAENNQKRGVSIKFDDAIPYRSSINVVLPLCNKVPKKNKF